MVYGTAPSSLGESNTLSVMWIHPRLVYSAEKYPKGGFANET